MKLSEYPFVLLDESQLKLNETMTVVNVTIASKIRYIDTRIQRSFSFYDRLIGLIPMNGKVKDFIAIITVLINGLCAALTFLLIANEDKAYRACIALAETGCTGAPNWAIFLFVFSSFIGLFIGIGAIYSGTRKAKPDERPGL